MIQNSAEEEAESLINQYLEIVIDADRDNIQPRETKISLAKRGALICIDKMIDKIEETPQKKHYQEIKEILESE
jgi:hypothetical protein